MNNFFIEEVGIKKINEHAKLPEYAHLETGIPGGGNAGADLFSLEEVVIYPGSRAVVGTGLIFELPLGIEAQIRSKSGLAAKHGVQVLNSPGTIDSTYRGEVMVILHNHGDRPYILKAGDKIAQVVFSRYTVANFKEVAEVSETLRSDGKFASTGY